MKLNKWQKEIRNLEKQADKNISKDLHKVYNDIHKDLLDRVAEYVENFDNLPEYEKQNAIRLEKLRQDVKQMINNTYPDARVSEVNDMIESFQLDSYSDGYFATFYQIEAEKDLDLGFIGFDKELVNQTIKTPTEGKYLSERLYEHRDYLADRTTDALRSGLVQGIGVKKIAKEISLATEANYSKSLRIARTEAGRMRSLARQSSMERLQEKGIKIQKAWLSALDSRTRNSHALMNGQKVGVNENFISPKGHQAKMPKMFGVASEDINCRCTVVSVVEDIAPTVQRRGDGELVPFKTYDGWKRYKDIQS